MEIPRSRKAHVKAMNSTPLHADAARRKVPAWATMPEINTWRAFEENISQQTIMEFVERWEANGFRFGCVTIDEGWTRRDAAFGDWVPDVTRFPDLRGLVEWLHAKGYRVRLWVAPMLVNEGADAAQSSMRNHFLVGESSTQVRQFGRNALVLDTRVPAVQQHIVAMMERLTRDYDVDGYKVDFCLTKADHGQPSGYPNDNYGDEERERIHRDLFRSVRTGCDGVKAGVRLESYPLEYCREFIDDVISGDLIGTGRSQVSHEEMNCRLLQLSRSHGWVAWPEMIWGLGSETPIGNPNWERTYLEWLATDINYERKLEFSFPPFAYANHEQIRTLTNLYASGGSIYKVAHAGVVSFDPFKLEDAGIVLSPSTRFLAAPHSHCEIHFVVPPSCGMPSEWEVVGLLRSEAVQWQARHENWGDGKRWHCLRFTGQAGNVYEIRRRM